MSETDETAVAEGAAADAGAPPAPAADESVVLADGSAVAAAASADDARTGRQARVFLCERGHRTVSLWSTPSTCRASVSRRDECGRPLHPIGELPEQVQKALNPLKASKKASKKG